MKQNDNFYILLRNNKRRSQRAREVGGGEEGRGRREGEREEGGGRREKGRNEGKEEGGGREE